MMWGASEGMGWWMLFGSVFWIAVIGLLIYAFARAFDQDGRHSTVTPVTSTAEPPLEIARRRYAAGELSEEDFNRIRENLKS